MFSHVPLHVQGEVIGAGESPLTEVALEGSVACVFPVVTGQLVGAGEFPAASLPGTVVWLFTCNPWRKKKTGYISMLCQ